VERVVSQIASRGGRRLKLRYRGTVKNHAWLTRRTAGLNLRNLVGRGLTARQEPGYWPPKQSERPLIGLNRTNLRTPPDTATPINGQQRSLRPRSDHPYGHPREFHRTNPFKDAPQTPLFSGHWITGPN